MKLASDSVFERLTKAFQRIDARLRGHASEPTPPAPVVPKPAPTSIKTVAAPTAKVHVQPTIKHRTTTRVESKDDRRNR